MSPILFAKKSIPKLTSAGGIAGIILSLALSQPTAAFMPISGSICQGGLHTPSITVTTPANNSSVSTPTAQLAITAHWTKSVTIQGGATVVTTPLHTLATETTTVSVPLTTGSNHLTLVATGGCPETTDVQSLTLMYDQNTATVHPTVSASRSPALFGRVSTPGARVFLVIHGHTYEATNNGDGTWTLPEGVITPDLVDGSYPVRIYTTNAAGDTILSDETQSDLLIIDTIPPTGTITTTSSTQRSPAIHGTINSPYVSITLIINGHTYHATNNGDGTWTLPEGVMQQLASGTYAVTVTLTDRAGNTTTLQSTLTITAKNEIDFILAPNTGFARIGSLNIPSLYLYLFVLGTAIGGIWLIRRRRQAQAALPPRRRKHRTY